MSCPSWMELATWRQSLDGAEPDGWTDALAHLDSCRDCRDEALAADPTLIFRRLPALALDTAGEADEIAAVQQAVAAMRTAGRLRRVEGAMHWKRWAAAAAVAATAGLGLGTWYEVPAHGPAPVAAARPIAASALEATEIVPAAQRVENLDLPNAEVKEFGGKNREDVNGATIYAPSLDV